MTVSVMCVLIHLIVRTARAITHGISAYVGSIQVGKLADLVLWKPDHFGAKPEMVLKSGVIVWAQVTSSSSTCSLHSPDYPLFFFLFFFLPARARVC